MGKQGFWQPRPWSCGAGAFSAASLRQVVYAQSHDDKRARAHMTSGVPPKAQIEGESIYMPFLLHRGGGARAGRPNPHLSIGGRCRPGGSNVYNGVIVLGHHLLPGGACGVARRASRCIAKDIALGPSTAVKAWHGRRTALGRFNTKVTAVNPQVARFSSLGYRSTISQGNRAVSMPVCGMLLLRPTRAQGHIQVSSVRIFKWTFPDWLF